MSVIVEKVTEHATLLLIVAVLAFFINSLFFVMADKSVVILGTGILGAESLIYLEDLGTFFDVISAILNSVVALCAGLCFAAVCFDENRDIWFRVVSVVALMAILFGGLTLL